jgi:hypothetical protein
MRQAHEGNDGSVLFEGYGEGIGSSSHASILACSLEFEPRHLLAHSLGVLSRRPNCRPTEKVPLNLIEVILAQGSMFSHGLTAFSGERQPLTGTADLPTFCMEQTDGKFTFF